MKKLIIEERIKQGDCVSVLQRVLADNDIDPQWVMRVAMEHAFGTIGGDFIGYEITVEALVG